jgi:heme o synthase
VLQQARRRPRIAAYVALTKPRIIELLLITTIPAMVVAEGGVPGLGLIAATVAGGTLAAGGANAINMYVDRDIDRLMRRTQGRPLVTGEIEPGAALAFAVVIEVAAFALLWALVNLLSAVLALAACLFYVGVYTLWLKRRSTQNIVIGGAAGAAPVLIGWSAVTGSLSWSAFVLFLIVFAWTPPHFWALAIRYRDDYATAGVPMLPVVTSLERTSRQIVAYTAVLVGITLLLWPVAGLGFLYGGAALVSGAVFLGGARQLQRDPTPSRAMRLFGYSITYLTVLSAALVVDVLVRHGW